MARVMEKLQGGCGQQGEEPTPTGALWTSLLLQTRQPGAGPRGPQDSPRLPAQPARAALLNHLDRPTTHNGPPQGSQRPKEPPVTRGSQFLEVTREGPTTHRKQAPGQSPRTTRTWGSQRTAASGGLAPPVTPIQLWAAQAVRKQGQSRMVLKSVVRAVSAAVLRAAKVASGSF